MSASSFQADAPSFAPPPAELVEALRAFPLREMRDRRQWCGFRIIPQAGGKLRKTPVMVEMVDRCAKSTDPATWTTFDAALQGLADGAYSAAGYALAGDIVGIDLVGQRWVGGDGRLTAEASAIVARCGSYAEWSISGKGIHILLHGALPGLGRRNDVGGVEMYTTARFFIVTGRQLDDTPKTIADNQGALDWLLAAYLGSESASDAGLPTERPETPEHMASVVSGFSVGSVVSVDSAVSAVSVDDVIAQTLPAKQGQRNGCILRLARGLKFDAKMADRPLADLKPIVRRWHAEALPIIGTKDFDETWADFTHAWPKVRIPLSFKAESWAMGKAKAEPLPAVAGHYDNPTVRLLVGVCWHLASLHQERRFFLSSHGAGALLGVSHDRVLRWLNMLCADRVLKLLERGNQRRANRYRYCHGDAPTEGT